MRALLRRSTLIALVAVLAAAALPLPARADTSWTTRTLAWGWNSYGQLGDNTDNHRSTAVTVQAQGPRFLKVAAGNEHSLGLAADGTVWAWGRNHLGQLGNGTGPNQHRPVRVAGLTNVTQIAAGGYGSLALRSDGTLWAWGDYILLGNGTQNNSGIPAPVPGMTGVVQISARYLHVLALKNDGTLWSWGGNNEGQLGDGTIATRLSPVRVREVKNIVSIAAGSSHNLAADRDGSVWAWGKTSYGFDPDIPFGTDRRTPVRINLTNIVQVATGYNHSLALDSTGRMWVWGYNNRGQYGNGTNATPDLLHVPQPITTLSGVTRIAAGGYLSAAITGDKLYTWGDNRNGQLGSGGTEHFYPLPRVVPGVGPAIMVSAGGGFLLAVQADPPPPAPSPIISVTPESVSVPAGRSTTATVTLDSAAGSFPLNAVDLPTGVTATFEPQTISVGETATMTITASPDAPVRSATVTVQAIHNREPVGSAPLTLVVTGPLE